MTVHPYGARSQAYGLSEPLIILILIIADTAKSLEGALSSISAIGNIGGIGKDRHIGISAKI